MIAPIYAGWVYDTTGTYMTVFTVFTISLAFSAVVMALARPPTPPAETADIERIV
jgi:hypothetical protein